MSVWTHLVKDIVDSISLGGEAHMYYRSADPYIRT
jgi:hypothetical protein